MGLGDEWVASYNPLLMLFDCHIHVDIVTTTACVKYLFKYVHKGEDYAKARIQGITDDIELYRKNEIHFRCRSNVETARLSNH